jgi:hypothetical protein
LGVEGICLSIIKNLFTSATVHFNSHRDAQVALGIAVGFVVLNPAITNSTTRRFILQNAVRIE